MKNKIYWFAKAYEDELETVNWKVINSQPDIASDCHALYDIMRHQATKSGGRLRFSEEKPFTPSLLVKTFLPWVSEERGLEALKALIKSDLVHTQKGTFIISNSDEMFGHDTDMARYLRKHRQKANGLGKKELSNGYHCKPTDNHPETPLHTTPIESKEHKETPYIPQPGSSEPNGVEDDCYKQAKDFFGQYPKQANFDDVVAWFRKTKTDGQTYSAILIALSRDKSSLAWRTQNGRFVPLPVNWLSKSRWTKEDITNAAYEAEERELNSAKQDLPGTVPLKISMPEAKQIPEKGERA